MSALDRFVPVPRLIEQHHVDVRAPSTRAHALLRHIDLRRSGAVRALLAFRNLPQWLRGHAPRAQRLTLDDLVRLFELTVLVDEPTTFAAGADASPRAHDLAIALELRSTPLGERDARVTVELRVSCGDDDESWRRLERAHRLLGPVGRATLRHVLQLACSEFGDATSDSVRPLTQSA
jgi:hypothetical protein